MSQEEIQLVVLCLIFLACGLSNLLATLHLVDVVGKFTRGSEPLVNAEEKQEEHDPRCVITRKMWESEKCECGRWA